MGVVDIIIGESEKKKGKKSRSQPTEKKWGENKPNHPDDEPARRKSFIIITIVRIDVEVRI